MERIPIWGEKIPYNSTHSKFADMHINFKKKNKLMAMLRFLANGICGDTYRDSSCVIDTWSYLAEIRPGFGKETYEDVPYITPFLVPGSKRAILIVPGGGFSYKQSDLDGEGKQAEGDLVARELNKAGISAFVLWYRTNPYQFPIPLLDMQRAVRFLRFHAGEYGIDPAYPSSGKAIYTGIIQKRFADSFTCTDKKARFTPGRIITAVIRLFCFTRFSAFCVRSTFPEPLCKSPAPGI